MLRWIHPDVLSYLATAITIGTAFCFVYAADRPALLLGAIGLTFLRMTLNTLDGLLAIQRGRLSAKGEIVNALPDRYSDVLLLAGIALSPLCRPIWGVVGLSSALLVSYTGVLGKALGAGWQHHGPLGKVERLICVMLFSLLQFLRLRSGSPAWSILGWSLTPLECSMILFAVLGQVTVFNRTRGILRQTACLEWREKHAARDLGWRVLVTYDSVTGNTEKVAGAIADCLEADLKRVEDVHEPQAYDLIVIGSPTIGSRPTDKAMRFLRANPRLPRYAAFVTYGAPAWGPISARKCLACFGRTIGTAPAATFSCKGRHALIKTYKNRPNKDDLLRAFLFGMKLSRAGKRDSWTTHRSANRSCG